MKKLKFMFEAKINKKEIFLASVTANINFRTNFFSQ